MAGSSSDDGSGGRSSGGGYQSVLFTNDPLVVKKEKEGLVYCGSEEQDVLCIDERQVRARSRNMGAEPEPSAEGVSINLANRPATAVVASGGTKRR